MNLAKLNGKIAETKTKKKKLAAYMGITPQALGRKLNGQTKMTVDDALKICECLPITSDTDKIEIFLL